MANIVFHLLRTPYIKAKKAYHALNKILKTICRLSSPPGSVIEDFQHPYNVKIVEINMNEENTETTCEDNA